MERLTDSQIRKLRYGQDGLATRDEVRRWFENYGSSMDDDLSMGYYNVAKVDRGCPYCGAGPDEFCHTPAGKPRSDHAQREYEEADPDDAS